jgi:hypothetical protein
VARDDVVCEDRGTGQADAAELAAAQPDRHAPDDDFRSVRIHALVQRVGVEKLAVTAAVALIRVAADALICVWPAIEADAIFGRVLRSNATVLLGRHPTALWLAETHLLLFRLGDGLIDSGLVSDAAAY